MLRLGLLRLAGARTKLFGGTNNTTWRPMLQMPYSTAHRTVPIGKGVPAQGFSIDLSTAMPIVHDNQDNNLLSGKIPRATYTGGVF